MKTDLYTKIVLTVIAGALIAIFFKLSDSNLITTAQAAAIPAPAPQAVQREVIDVNLVQVNGMNLYERLVNLKDGTKAGYIPVSLESVDGTTSTLNVNIKDISKKYVYEGLTSDYICVYPYE